MGLHNTRSRSSSHAQTYLSSHERVVSGILGFFPLAVRIHMQFDFTIFHRSHVSVLLVEHANPLLYQYANGNTRFVNRFFFPFF